MRVPCEDGSSFEPRLPEVSYAVATTTGQGDRVSGVQVGLFAIRETLPDEKIQCGDGGRYQPHAVAIDHWPSGIMIMSARAFEDALILADELSRRAAVPARPCAPDELGAALGPVLLRWTADSGNGPPAPLPGFCASHRLPLPGPLPCPPATPASLRAALEAA